MLARVFGAVGLLAVFVAGIYRVENWRGRRAWTAVAKRLPDAQPLKIADEDNFACAPILTRIDASLELGGGGKAPVGLTSWRNGQVVDLEAWRAFYAQAPNFPHPAAPRSPGDDVLFALTRFDPDLAELAQAMAARPVARFRLGSGADFGKFPGIGRLSAFSRLLGLRSTAFVATGRTSDALRDIDVVFALRRAVAQEPLLIHCVTASLLMETSLQPIWEGLAARRWSAEELAILREQLLAIDLLAQWREAARVWEPRFLAACFDHPSPPLPPGVMTPELRLAAWLYDWAPRGWMEQQKAVGSQFYLQAAEAVSSEERRVFPQKLKLAREQLNARPWFYRGALTTSGALAEVTLERIARAQSSVDQAAAACAVEAERLSRGAYPSALPDGAIDRLSGEPLRFKLTPDGRYQIYSLGWDEFDDGGRDERKDWIWSYAPRSSEASRPQ